MSTENSSASSAFNVEKCSLVLVDVAGTTTSINFVKDTLFPFISKNAEAFLKSQWDQSSLKESLKKLQETDSELDVAAAAELVKSLTEKNSDIKELKEIQGSIYKKGYEDGELKGHVFPDVAAAFESWASTRKVAIYSSGSIESQKLLFAHTESGDLSAHISDYFDLSVGPKTEVDSYKKIAEEAKTQLDEIVFISDDSNEVKAAKSAGMSAYLIQRDEVAATTTDLTVIKSFKDLTFENASKRKIEDPSETEIPPAKIAKSDETGKAPEESKKAPEEKKEDPEKMEVAEEEEESKKTEEDTTKTADKKETEETPASTAAASKKTEDKAQEVKEPEEKKPETEATVEIAEDATKKTEATNVEEKASEKEEAKVEDETEKESVENGDQVGGEEKPAKTEEKENKSVLANGVENGEKVESVTENNGTAEAGAETKEESDGVATPKPDDSDVKVKKLEESAESKTVSVEV